MESDTCTLYKNAELDKITENNISNAGICPKSDKTHAWENGRQSILPTEIPFPDIRKELWCGDGGKMCTFPFQIQNDPTYYSEPYNNKCGTDDSWMPIAYSTNELETAQLCTGKTLSRHRHLPAIQFQTKTLLLASITKDILFAILVALIGTHVLQRMNVRISVRFLISASTSITLLKGLLVSLVTQKKHFMKLATLSLA